MRERRGGGRKGLTHLISGRRPNGCRSQKKEERKRERDRKDKQKTKVREGVEWVGRVAGRRRKKQSCWPCRSPSSLPPMNRTVGVGGGGREGEPTGLVRGKAKNGSGTNGFPILAFFCFLYIPFRWLPRSLILFLRETGFVRNEAPPSSSRKPFQMIRRRVGDLNGRGKMKREKKKKALGEWCRHGNIMDGPGPLANLIPSNPNVSLSWVVLVPGKQYPETGISEI